MRKISMAAARVNARLNQSEMSEKMGVCKNIIIDWEKGRKEPKMSQFVYWCSVCGFSPNEVEWIPESRQNKA